MSTGAGDVPVLAGRYVQVPTDLPALSDIALVRWILHVWFARGEATSVVTLDQLQDALGRTGDDPGHLTRVQRELEAAGLLEVERVRVDVRTLNRYRPLRRVRPGDRREWVNLPAAALVALAAGSVKPHHVAALYRWMVTFRREEHWTPEDGCWTASGVTDRAAEWGQAVRTVRSHRSCLVKSGMLAELKRPGRAPLTALPGHLPEVRIPRQRMSEHPGNGCRNTPAKDPGNGCRSLVPTPDVPPICTEEQNPPSVPEGTDRTARTTRGRTSEASPRSQVLIKTKSKLLTARPADSRPAVAGSEPSPDAWRVLGRLPRPWRECPGWVRRRLAERIDRALDPEPIRMSAEFVDWHLSRGLGHQLRRPPIPLTADQIVDAVTRYAPSPTGLEASGDVERHTRALDEVLILAFGDAKARPDPDQPDLADLLAALPTGQCVSCDSTHATLREDLPIPVPVCDLCLALATIGNAA